MSGFVILLVLGAAVLHASWNAMVKSSGDRVTTLGLIAAGHVVIGAVLALQSPLPTGETWVFVAASTVVHFAYYFLLYHSYRLGDLSHVYPIARGISPVLVSLGAMVFAHEMLPPLAWAGILAASTGIFMLSGNVFKGETPPIVVLTALATGAIIASYSLVDGMGVRTVQQAGSFIGWAFLAEGFAAVFMLGRSVQQKRPVRGKPLLLGLVGGLLSGGAYGLVIYAASMADLGLVSTLRETSVVFAALIGVVLLGERPWRLRLVASGVVVAGVVLMTWATA